MVSLFESGLQFLNVTETGLTTVQFLLVVVESYLITKVFVGNMHKKKSSLIELLFSYNIIQISDKY